MGFFNFLKAKKGPKQEEMPGLQEGFGRLPPLSSESELYSELPNLPEAPETSGLPEIELPPPLKGLGDLDFPEGLGNNSGHEFGTIQPPKDYRQGRAPVEPLIPSWPKSEETKLQNGIVPDLPSMPEAPEKKPWENTTPADVPELMLPEPKPNIGNLISHKNSFFLKAEDFRMVRDNIEAVIKAQKKHHRLTDIKKEENAHFEQISAIIEDAQRKLMHIDRTLFE